MLRADRSPLPPTFELAGIRFVKRITLIVRDGVIEEVFYPVFPPDGNAEEVTGGMGEAAGAD